MYKMVEQPLKQHICIGYHGNIFLLIIREKLSFSFSIQDKTPPVPPHTLVKLLFHGGLPHANPNIFRLTYCWTAKLPSWNASNCFGNQVKFLLSISLQNLSPTCSTCTTSSAHGVLGNDWKTDNSNLQWIFPISTVLLDIILTETR